MKFNQRRLVVVSGPSGCGKDTVVKELIRIKENVSVSVSCTTRAVRGCEQHGVNYYYITKQEFNERLAKGRMLEYTEYADNLYGTPMDELEQKLADDQTVILVIEVNGAKQVKEIYPDSLLVFIIPPSLEELERRLKLRATEDISQVEERLMIAKTELKSLADYDIVIENDVVSSCAKRLSDAIDDWQTKDKTDTNL